MASNTTVEIDPVELKKAEKLWDNFLIASKLCGVLIALTLIGLAAAFVPFGS